MATAKLPINELDKELLLSRAQQLIFVDCIAGFECQRCDRPLVHHYEANCGHKFCANCKRVLIRSRSNCPLAHCGKAIGDMDLQDVEFERKLYELRAYCPNKSYGCPFVSQLKDLGCHLRVCEDTRDNALPVLIQGNDIVNAVLRELSVKFNKLGAETSESLKDIGSKVDNTMRNIESEIDNKLSEMKREIDKKMWELSSKIEVSNIERDKCVSRLDKSVKDMESNVNKCWLEMKEADKKLTEMISKLDEKANEKEIEKELKNMKKEFEMFKINNQKEDVIEINRRIRMMNKELSDQNNKMKQELEFLKQETEKITENLSKDSSHLEEKLFNLETFISQINPKMDCFSLAEDKVHFQPDFSWKIIGLKEKAKQTTYEIRSEEFEWSGYPGVKARVRLEAKDNGWAHMSLCLNVDNLNKAMTIKTGPTVYYVLRDRSGNKSPQHRCSCQNQLSACDSTSPLHYYEMLIVQKQWLARPPYNVNDSVTIEIFVEPPLMAQQVHSYDGSLDWTIDNYARRKQMTKQGLAWVQESPYFYTWPKGYRVQVGMVLDGSEEYAGKGLSAQVACLPGKFDSDLPYIYPHRVTVTLFNRKEPPRDITKTVDIVMRKGADYTIDVCLDKETETVIMNDTLSYKVTVKPL